MTVRPPSAAEPLEIAGERACCDLSGALWLPERRLLAVSDLHLEKGAAFARRGQFLPPYDTLATLQRLGEAVARYQPRAVVSLGDGFHDRHGARLMPDCFRRPLAEIMRGRDWIWIAGNHDPEPPGGLEGETAAELQVGGLTFRHEPSAGDAPGEVAGHLHPCAVVVSRGRGFRRRCFATDGQRLILPAFGSLTGSLNVLDRAYRGLFRWRSFRAYLLGSARVLPIPGTKLAPG